MTIDEENGGTESPFIRPRCFFDVKFGLQGGRVMFELFADKVPKTTDNFRYLCNGEKGIGKTTDKPLYYKNSIFHRVVKDFMIQGGDFSNGNGTGGESIYGGTFEDEGFFFKHDRPFLLSMANRGQNTNGSQFFITTQPAPHLDNIHVVFGHVVAGHDIVKQIEQLPIDRNSRPLQDVVITNCGELVRQLKIIKITKKKKKKKKQRDSQSESSSESSSSSSEDEKKKSKRKKAKKKQSKLEKVDPKKPAAEDEVSEKDRHPLAQVHKIDIDEIPEVTNKFLMRADVSEDKRKQETLRDKSGREKEKRFGWSKSTVPLSRSGRMIKGRGAFRYRTPSRSRSKSRSTTPPHWKVAQKNLIKYDDLKKIEAAKTARDQEVKRREAERRRRHEELAREGVRNAKKSFYEIDRERGARSDRKGRESFDMNALDYESEEPTKQQKARQVLAGDRSSSDFDHRRDRRRSRSFGRNRSRRSPPRNRNRNNSPQFRQNRSPMRQNRSPQRRSLHRSPARRGGSPPRTTSQRSPQRSGNHPPPRKSRPSRSRSRNRSLDKATNDRRRATRRSSSHGKTPPRDILPDSAPKAPSPMNIPLPAAPPPPLTEEERARQKKEKMLKRAETLLLLKSHMEKEIEEQKKREKEKEKAKQEQERVAKELQNLEKLKMETLQKLKTHDELRQLATIKKVIDSSSTGSAATGSDRKKAARRKSPSPSSSSTSSSSSSSRSSSSERESRRKKKYTDKKKPRRRSRSSS